MSDAVADELKLESQNISINAQVRANNSLEIIVNNYTQSGAIDVIGDISIQVTSEARLDDNASIQSSNLFFSAYDFYNQADLTIEDNATFDIGNDFQNGFRLNRTDYDGGDISANNFNVAAGGYFYNYNATINANDFNVVAGDYFYNIDSATISADNFNVTAGNDFYNDRSATINANDFNVTAGRFFYNHSFATINANNFNVIAGDYFYNHNSATINVNNFNVTAGYNFSNRYSSTINADNFNVTAGNDFDNYATINADSFNVTLKGNYSYFDNRDNATINADSFNVTTDSFFNETNSTITANECNIIYTTSYTDNGTITCNDEIEVIDIARPDANGLSNNSYTDFNILNSGIVLNNSDSAGTSQLAGDISANTNYISGDAASLILAQITGNDISLLEGALEVFGAEAGVIIANPSGITCNGCSFINASRVDLVTGSNYNSSTASFNDIANTNIALIDNGFDASSVGILNIQAGSFTNAGGLNANIFNLSVAGDFDYTNRGTITTTGFNLNVGGDFSNNDAANDFTWGAQNSLTVLGNASFNVDDFYNKGKIDVANDFNVIAGDDFFNTQNATISANNFSVLTQDRFYNLHNATISVNDFNVTAGSLFANRYSANISANGFNVTAADNFYNTDSATISANDITISTNSFVNSHTRGDGNINADTLSISLIGDFDYTTDYLGNGNINATTLNLQVGGDFFY